jgi:hypothetical protein
LWGGDHVEEKALYKKYNVVSPEFFLIAFLGVYQHGEPEKP